MRVLVAPNALKGTLSCVDAARAVSRGVRSALRGARVTSIPIADGGDGLIDALRAALGGVLVSASARGPRGERRRASYLWVDAKKLAVIEMARVSGLALVPPAKRRPLAATSRGTGDLIRDAVRRGARAVIVGMGGAASSDGGAGMARALGARLLDAQGTELPDGAEALLRLARVEAAVARRLLAGVRVTALADVINPLLGPNGSAAVFGPQKGASKSEVKLIERALTHWAAILARDLAVNVARASGGGAAGGLGAGLLAFANAEIVPGADWILAKTGALEALKNCDFALTAEGRLDKTSLYGKAPVALARAAKKMGVHCAAIAGQVENAARPALQQAGMRRLVSFSEAGAKSTEDAMKNAAKWARKAAAVAASGLAVFAVSTVPVRAADVDFHSIDRQYFNRHSGTNLDINIERLEKLDRGGPALWRLCRAKIRRAEKKDKRAAKLAEYESAKADCEKSVALSPGAADAHYWLGVALGRWGETKGLMKALFVIKPLKKEMAETLRLDPSHGGAHNVLGEILWQVPGFAGGDKKRALQEFEAALRLAPNYTANHQPLAEAYLHFKRREDAIRVLKLVETVRQPADPAEYPDNLADAKKLLATLESGR
ncbi:MAG: glycerate kinase [Elusimicrobia bacterium]|nr:glycerate kinase [Elusimicrobiota bacterium]